MSITPYDAIERSHLADALMWVESGAQIFRTSKPATPRKHLVSYFAVIDAEHILLVDHRNARLWLPTGGHVEIGEHPRTTVVRELQEELGIATTVAQIGPPRMVTVAETVGLTGGHTDVSLWYVVTGSRTAAIEFDLSEFSQVSWFRFSDAPVDRSDPNLQPFLAKLRSTGFSTSRNAPGANSATQPPG
jgi:8-oxo-dGTP diphosphatase